MKKKCEGPSCQGLPLGKLGLCRSCLEAKEREPQVWDRWKSTAADVRATQVISDELWNLYLEARANFLSVRGGT